MSIDPQSIDRPAHTTLNNRCYACSLDPRESGPSKEHFIPEVIGGVRKAPILCKEHNEEFGYRIDPALCEAFQVFRVFLGLVEEGSGKPRPNNALLVRFGDQEFLLGSNGDIFLRHPKFISEDLPNGKKRIQIQASSAEESDQLLRQLKNRYPKLDASDFEKQPSQAKPDAYYSASFQIGGNTVFKALLKIAVGYAAFQGVDPLQMKSAIAGLLDHGEGDRGFVAPLKERITKVLDERRFNHTVIVYGSSETGLLVVFMELFGCAPYLVVLSKQYSGQEVHESYSLDPISGKEDICTSTLTMGRNELDVIFRPDEFSDEFMNCVKLGLSAGIEHQRLSREVSDLISQGMSHMRELGHQELTQENMHIFSRFVADQFIQKRMGRRRPKNEPR